MMRGRCATSSSIRRSTLLMIGLPAHNPRRRRSTQNTPAMTWQVCSLSKIANKRGSGLAYLCITEKFYSFGD